MSSQKEVGVPATISMAASSTLDEPPLPNYYFKEIGTATNTGGSSQMPDASGVITSSVPVTSAGTVTSMAASITLDEPPLPNYYFKEIGTATNTGGSSQMPDAPGVITSRLPVPSAATVTSMEASLTLDEPPLPSYYFKGNS